jgi:NADH-quinone oxidoreductase subunit H
MTGWFQSYLGFGGGWFVANTIFILAIALPLMLAVAMLIYADRKIWAAMALRRGPNVVGPFGLLQSFADGLKVFLQETIIPSSADKGLFLLAPIITFTVALIVWAVIPFDAGVVLADINVGLLYILAASSLGVYGVIMAGWASNSKYPFYSALRAAAQMVSYEVSIGFILISVVLWAGSFNMSVIVEAQRGHGFGIINGFAFNLLLFPMAVMFFISSLAETARAPFDLTEAESELVAGYQTEYSSMSFALYWLGEYANVILMCALNAILFWGGYLPPIDWAPLYVVPGIIWLFAKILVFFFLFSWVKATVPRYRYDQLMRLGWKIFLPISLLWVFLVSGYLMLTRYGGQASASVAAVPAVSRDAIFSRTSQFQRKYECEIELTPSAGSDAKAWIGSQRLKVGFFVGETDGKAAWFASGDLNRLHHAVIDQPFPAGVLESRNATEVRWKIHGEPAHASIAWRSLARDAGDIVVVAENDGKPSAFGGPTRPYQFNGSCQTEKPSK